MRHSSLQRNQSLFGNSKEQTPLIASLLCAWIRFPPPSSHPNLLVKCGIFICPPGLKSWRLLSLPPFFLGQSFPPLICSGGSWFKPAGLQQVVNSSPSPLKSVQVQTLNEMASQALTSQRPRLPSVRAWHVTTFLLPSP